MKTRLALCLGFAWWMATAYAQQTPSPRTATGGIPAVSADGFYKVALTTAWYPYAGQDLSRLRIYQTQQQEVPYLIQEEVPQQWSTTFQSYPIASKTIQPKAYTRLVLENKERRAIDNIHLQMSNAAVVKTADLQGSDDGQQWYVVKDRFTLSPQAGNAHTQSMMRIDFPLCNYPYLALTLNDSTSPPLNIVQAGYYAVQQKTGAYLDLPTVALRTVDSARTTYIFLRFAGMQWVDQVQLQVTAPTLFHREATLGTRAWTHTRKGDSSAYLLPHHSLVLHAAGNPGTLTFNFPTLYTDELVLAIDNQDNPPLTLEVKAFTLKRYLTAQLRAGVSYTLASLRDAYAPTYDLAFFRDSIPDSVKVLLPEAPIATVDSNHATTTPSRFRPWMIWAGIVAVVALLAFMSVKLIREASQEQRRS